MTCIHYQIVYALFCQFIENSCVEVVEAVTLQFHIFRLHSKAIHFIQHYKLACILTNSSKYDFFPY